MTRPTPPMHPGAPTHLVLILILSLVLLTLLAACSTAPAPLEPAAAPPPPGPGALDPSFDGDGRQTTDLSGLDDAAYAVAIQPDRKIVVVGDAGDPLSLWNTDFAVVRYNTDGSLDSTFGANGTVITDVDTHSGDDDARAVAIQDDGKIVVAGESFGDFALVRYNSDGSRDSGFGTGIPGIVTTGLTGGNFGEAAYAVAIQDDGKIVIAGTTGGSVALLRYTANGLLDSTFGNQGSVTSYEAEAAYAMALQRDGKIVVAGYAGTSDQDVAVLRFEADGSLDTSFDGDGVAITDLGSSEDVANAIVIQPGGKIVVAGETNNGVDDDFALVRYNSDGSLDSSFGAAGIVITDFGGSYDRARGIALAGVGRKLIVAGTRDGTSAVARYLDDGSLDSNFDTDGWAIGGSTSVRALAVAPPIRFDLAGREFALPGRIVVVGTDTSGDDDFAVERFLP